MNLATLGAEAPVESVPGHEKPVLATLTVKSLVASPLNPRRNFGTPEELTELGEGLKAGQLQAVVVVSATKYLRLWPDHAEKVGDAKFVLVNGERRWRAARAVGLTALDALIRESLADDRATFLDAVVKENIDRRNFDPIEEALAVEQMVTECGSGAAAATKFGRTKGWVSQRRALLKLTPELQDQLRDGELPVRIARTVAGLPVNEQIAAVKARLLEESQIRTGVPLATPAPPAAAPSPSPAVPPAVPTPPAAGKAGPAVVPSARPPVEAPAAGKPSKPSPAVDAGVGSGGGPEEARSGSAVRRENPLPDPSGIPWDSLVDLSALIRQNLPRKAIDGLIALLEDA